MPDFLFRTEVAPADVAQVGALCRATGVFSSAEVAVAEELVAERLAKGPASGYHFVLAQEGGGLAGYACFGPIPCTVASFDLYWIVVDPARHREGLGGRLLALSEAAARGLGAARLYVETSSRPAYLPARSFYLRHGFAEASVLPDFYAPGDGKVTYLKVLGRA
jgi:ribosomal protein S18 acetylase RimI-like enzyme